MGNKFKRPLSGIFIGFIAAGLIFAIGHFLPMPATGAVQHETTPEAKMPIFYAVKDINITRVEHLKDEVNSAGLYDFLKKNVPAPKGEYETEQEYQDRRTQYYRSLNIEKYSIDDLFVFKDEDFGRTDDLALSSHALFFKYDAEKRVIIGEPLSSPTLHFTSATADNIYSGSNAFGVTRSVSLKFIKSLVVDFENERNLSEKKFILPSPPEEAKLLKPKLEIVYLAKLIRPYTSETSDRKPPTIDNPEDSNHVYQTIHANLAAVLLVNSETGEVIKRMKFGG